ncbi:hypothetical protein PoB_002889300 [Plakobranchus ocellatus]|uniref:Uncharacterized protein n=1 Tax=Plakobranchus ocellatus TaxID=259542 RepID=A0AAV4A6N2_9GAST|nr:hypothetical protein PoB_002889300 [Plakobranchus ocellatus]
MNEHVCKACRGNTFANFKCDLHLSSNERIQRRLSDSTGKLGVKILKDLIYEDPGFNSQPYFLVLMMGSHREAVHYTIARHGKTSKMMKTYDDAIIITIKRTNSRADQACKLQPQPTDHSPWSAPFDLSGV